jgi:LPS sulfotransferase NodH
MPYYFRNQVTPYVILFIERDGSTYLTSLLTSHPDIEAIYERFAVLKQKNASGPEQLAWAKDFFTPPLLGKKKALGFKTKLVDILDVDGFTNLLKQKNIKIIQMRRRNRVKAVVSRINARRLYEASGNWNLYKDADRMPAMEIDPDQFAEYLAEREAADDELQAYVDQLNLPTLKIVYEELLVDKQGVLDKIFAFLNIPSKPVQEKTLKNTSDDLRDAVLNFDQLRSQYAGTIYESMFDEVLV